MTLTPTVLVDARLYLDSADLTGFSNKADLNAKATVLDSTTFSSSGTDAWRSKKGGLFEGMSTLEGFWQAGDLSMPDDVFWADLGASTVPLTALPTDGSVGSLAYLTRGVVAGYKFGDKVGQLLPWSADLETSWPVVRGQILHPQGTARTATGNGTARQLGAVDANHALYVCLHVLSYVDGSLTVAVESDDNSGMSSPTTQGTFTAATALGGQSMKIAGPITDDWWRITYTISGGSTHSFLFAVSAGIGPK